MENRYRKCALFFVIAILSVAVHGQEKTDFSLGLNGFYGVSSLQYDVDEGTHNTGWDMQASLESKIYFWEQFGIGLGVRFSKYHADVTLNDYSKQSIGVVDSEGDTYNQSATIDNLREKNRAEYLEIPLTFEWRTISNSKVSYNAGIGVMYSFHLYSHSTTSADNIEITAEYPQWNALLYDIPQHGLFSQSGWTSREREPFQNSFGLVLQSGIDYRVSEKVAINIGLFAHLGLSNVSNQSNLPLFYNPEAPNSIASTSDHVRLRSVGLQVGVKVFDQCGR